MKIDKNLLNVVVSIAQHAGEEILKIYKTENFWETLKADNSPLTAADIASHNCIMANLKLISDLPILSEESANVPFDERKNWKMYWLVDPLDGTKEFINRNDQFTVNIALIENGVPVLGVVYAPALGHCYSACKGFGSFVQAGFDKPQSISAARHNSSEILKVISSKSHGLHQIAQEMLLEKLGQVESIKIGSSLKFCYVAEGRAHLYPRLGTTMEWDTAAGHIILKEAGGVVLSVDETELIYNKIDLHNPNFIAAGHGAQILMRKIFGSDFVL